MDVAICHIFLIVTFSHNLPFRQLSFCSLSLDTLYKIKVFHCWNYFQTVSHFQGLGIFQTKDLVLELMLIKFPEVLSLRE